MPLPDPYAGLQSQFADSVQDLIQDAPGPLSIVSGYRSPEHQATLWNAALAKYGSAEAARKWVAPPGSSMHNKGEAVDLGYGAGGLGSGPQSLVSWAHQNAGQYGLTFPLANENWHIEPIGGRQGAYSTGGQSAPLANPSSPSYLDTFSPRLPAAPTATIGDDTASVLPQQPANKTWLDYLMPQPNVNQVANTDPWSRLFAGQNPFGDNPLRPMIYNAIHSMFS